MKNPLHNPYIAIPVLLLCFAKIATHFHNTDTVAIVVAVPEEATVQFVPEGE